DANRIHSVAAAIDIVRITEQKAGKRIARRIAVYIGFAVGERRGHEVREVQETGGVWRLKKVVEEDPLFAPYLHQVSPFRDDQLRGIAVKGVGEIGVDATL